MDNTPDKDPSAAADIGAENITAAANPPAARSSRSGENGDLDRSKNPIPVWRETEATSPSPISKAEDRQKQWPEFLRLEYSKGAERYENIYKAIWQNFSYMAVVSAAILTFVTKQPPGWPFESIVLAPLVFWFWATYVPMDRYGNDTRRRLAEIEYQINEIFFPSVGDPQLIHYTNFRTPKGVRVRHMVWAAGLLVSIFFAWPLVRPLCSDKETPAAEQQRLSPAIVSFSNDSQRVTIDFRPPATDSALTRRLDELQRAAMAQARSLDSLAAIVLRPR